MSAQKWTPGPWSHRPVGEVDFRTPAADDFCIVSDDQTCPGIVWGAHWQSGEANARLIAAAPALFEEHEAWAKSFGFALVRALQEDFGPIKQLAQSMQLHWPDGEPAIVSEALALATGETP